MRLKLTWKENTTMPEANRATPAVALSTIG
jgi:hypothetical protein